VLTTVAASLALIFDLYEYGEKRQNVKLDEFASPLKDSN
jgi:hypothetical protein